MKTNLPPTRSWLLQLKVKHSSRTLITHHHQQLGYNRSFTGFPQNFDVGFVYTIKRSLGPDWLSSPDFLPVPTRKPFAQWWLWMSVECQAPQTVPIQFFSYQKSRHTLALSHNLKYSSALPPDVMSINWNAAFQLCPMKTNGYWLLFEFRNLTLSGKRRAPREGISLSPAPSTLRWMVIGAAANGSSIKVDVSAVMHSLLIACRQADQYAINHGEKVAR